MNLDRRGWALAAGVAAAAATAGVGWSAWRQRGAGVGIEASAADALWSSSFDAPDGTRLAMSAFRGQALVLNFWATWCPPCIREMPALDRFARTFAPRGWRVVGLAADAPEPVREFLARTPVSYAIGLTGFAGIELSRRLGNLGGGLPFTLLFGRDGTPRQSRMGEISYEDLAGWARGIG
ncbi:MAG: TlpA disulfide reductase family protein [Burkholderiaceae bacterium]|nr:TlpA disulfide reductase family protein [Burkholderiaceae bacterium]